MGGALGGVAVAAGLLLAALDAVDGPARRATIVACFAVAGGLVWFLLRKPRGKLTAQVLGGGVVLSLAAGLVVVIFGQSEPPPPCTTSPCPTPTPSPTPTPTLTPTPTPTPTLTPTPTPTPTPTLTPTPTPTPPLTPTPSPTPEAERIERIEIEIDDRNAHKIGPGEYQVPEVGRLNLRYWYTTITNFGELDSNTCTVVARVVNTKTKQLAVAPTRSAQCTWHGWLGITDVQRGSYQISVYVKTETGAERTDLLNFIVR
ncbi:hypothetical protein OG394_00765 [Kribbella sp. NBC_01245]|uniref:hypothetical protein n=1 Tax=Kribbella sp. NBC_01245 TaxID=2903578 RepID=UPI002E2CD7A7|nr:hypothetical protein [Kribbella sp. NBC_01245]